MKLVINGESVESEPGSTILETALRAGIYIPAVCRHPDLPPATGCPPSGEIFRGPEKIGPGSGESYQGCGLCIVKVEGSPEHVLSCDTGVEEGMVIESDTPEIKRKRQEALARILADHPRACLLCAQKEGCSREPCSTDVPMEERCCPLLGICELEKVADYVGVPEDLGKYKPPGLPLLEGEPLFKRDYNLCIGCTRCVRACGELRGVEALGYVMKDGSSYVGTLHGPYFKDSGCRFCGACVEVCPTGAIMDIKPFSPSEKEDILIPCRAACPAGIDIPAYIRATNEGDTDRALSIVYESVPFPGILGMVCHHPCEDVCRREEIDEAVAICGLKRFAAENGKFAPAAPPPHATGKKVAVIGSGPAGLTAARRLRAAGHEVTVFEGEEKPGGMLRYGIPAYRLPETVLDGEISAVLNGVKLKTGAALGRDFQLSDLPGQGFDCTFLSTGAGKSKRLEIPGADSEGVYRGIDFLKRVRMGESPSLGGKVVVIGGGNVALDAALCCLRLGAAEVTVVCLECESDMPAFEKETEHALQEGVTILNSWGPREIESEEGRIRGVTLKRCTRVFDEEGRFSPLYDESALERLPADNVILAVGQEPDLNVISLPGMPDHAPSGLVITDETGTSINGVFSGGDAVRGASSVIEAIADGKKAADSIDRFLGGKGISDPAGDRAVDPRIGRDEKFLDRPRTPMPCMDPEERKKSFAVIELGYGREEAAPESNRCLQCDLRFQMRETVLPPERWLPFGEEALKDVPETEGVYQLAGEDKIATKIAGTQNLLRSLTAELGNENVKYFSFEEEPMYTKRESELIQLHLQKYGKLPGAGEDDLEDLF